MDVHPKPPGLPPEMTFELEEVPRGEGAPKLEEPADIGRPTMQIIKELVEERGYTMDDIEYVRIAGVKKCGSDGKPERVSLRDSRGVEVQNEKEEVVKTTYNRVDEWLHDGTSYAVLPITYEIFLEKDGKKMSFKFEQPRYTNVKIPTHPTARDLIRFERKLMALLAGVQAEIRSPILQKERGRERIAELMKQRVTSFEYVYSRGVIPGKQFSIFHKGDPGVEKGDRLGVVKGVQIARVNNAAGRVFAHFRRTILSEDLDLIRTLGFSHIGYMYYEPFTRVEEARKKCRKECAKSSRGTEPAKGPVKVDPILKGPEAVVNGEARDAAEKLLDMRDLLKREARSPSELDRYAREIQDKIKSIQEGIDGIPDDLKRAYGLPESQRTLQELTSGLDAGIEEEVDDLRPLLEDRRNLLEAYGRDPRTAFDNTYIQKLDGEDEKVQKESIDLEKKIRECTEEVERAGLLREKARIDAKQMNVNSLRQLIDRHKDIVQDLDNYEGHRRKLVALATRTPVEMEEIHEQLETVLVLSAQCAKPKEIERYLDYLEKAREEVDYPALGGLVQSFHDDVMKTPENFATVQEPPQEATKPDISRNVLHPKKMGESGGLPLLPDEDEPPVVSSTSPLSEEVLGSVQE